MKLYTQEQVKRAMLEYTSYSKPTMVQVIDTLNPIELPSDEEIEEYIESTPYYGTCTYEFKEGIQDGIKWMKEQILNQNK